MGGWLLTDSKCAVTAGEGEDLTHMPEKNGVASRARVKLREQSEPIYKLNLKRLLMKCHFPYFLTNIFSLGSCKKMSTILGSLEPSKKSYAPPPTMALA